VKQFILGSKPDKNNTVRLEGKDYRYLIRVRRLAEGEFFPALLPNGKETLVQILSIEGGILTGKCTSFSHDFSSTPVCEKNPRIILFQALPKSDKMDLIVRQAAEGGVAEIVPFVSEFSVAKVPPGKQKLTRWEKIIKEARQQSGSKTVTAIQSPLSMCGLFNYWKKLKEVDSMALGLLFHHQGLEQKSLHGYLNINPKTVVLSIGPEGGFSGKEVSTFLENGFKALTIGDTILRTETAALYCAAAIRVLLLEKNSWELKQI
jgi:16S rRNA (uracil1498-N3)-methyltransferase